MTQEIIAVTGIETDGMHLDANEGTAERVAERLDAARVAASAVNGASGNGVAEDASAERLERIAKLDAMAKRAGLSFGPTIRPIGQSIEAREKYENGQRKWEEMPALQEVCETIIATVKAESREDCQEDVSEIRMLPTGDLATKNAGILGFEPRGLKAFLAETLSYSTGGRVWEEDGAEGSAGYLLMCPPEMRADHMNYWMHHFDVEGRKDRSAARDVVFRTRLGKDGKRNIFGVVSPTYDTDCDADVMARIMLETAPEGARGEARYDGYRLTLDALFHSDVKSDDIGVGEIFKAGMRASTGDARNKGAAFFGNALRVRCVNLTTLPARVGKARRHRGESLKDRMRVDALDARKAIEGFATVWANAEKETIIDSSKDPMEAFDTLIKRGHLKVAGVKTDELKARLVKAWQAEPGYSKRHIVNAMTRAAHTNRWVNPWASQDIETQAGELLYQTVKVLS
jgi:hypothetical protein